MLLLGLLESPVDRGIVHPEMGRDPHQAIPIVACRREELRSRSDPFRKQAGERGALRLRLPTGHLRDQAIRLVASHEVLRPRIHLSLHLLPGRLAPLSFGDYHCVYLIARLAPIM